MAEYGKHAPGTFCWAELVTSDAEAAKRFYLPLCGWEHRDDEAGPDRVYTMLLQGGRNVGALYRMDEKLRAQGPPPHWGSYVSVSDLDATAGRVAALGGKLLIEPMDVMAVGRMATLQDPTGARLSLWQAKEHHGAQVMGEPVSLCWTELLTRDLAAAEAFYRGLFDWGSRKSGIGDMDYTEFTQGERSVAGMMPLGEEMGAMPPSWMLYFAVRGIDAMADQAAALGGRVLAPPQDIPRVGRFAIIQDPQGAVFGAITLGGGA